MSQYPTPYLPPNITPFGGPLDVLKPARRASLMMFVISALLILLSGCMIGVTFLFPYIPPAQLQPLRDRVESIAHLSPEILFRVTGAIVLVVGLILLTMGFFVRRGGMISSVFATAFVGLIVLQQLLSLIGAVMGIRDAATLGSAVAASITFAAFTVTFILLIAAVRAAPKVKSAQQQYLAQYWQYQQTAPAYTGYPTQPPAPPSAG